MVRSVFHNGIQVANDRLASAVTASHVVATRVDVLYNQVVVATDVRLVAGSISYDRTAATLARLTASFVESNVPLGDTSVLKPYGYEVQVWAGVSFPDGDDLVPLGVFPIQVSDADGIGLGTSLTAADRSQLVIDARFEDDYVVAAGTNYGTAIQALITAGVPGLTYVFTATTYTTPFLTFDSESDRWAAAQGMARSIGMELFFDGLGRCVMKPEPDLSTTAPVSVIAEGDGGVLVEITVHLDRGPAYNRVIAYSSNASLPVVYRGVWTDLNPTSPTYYYGGFGRKPRFYSSPFINSNAQATTAAQAIGRSALGVARSIDFGLVPNPLLEPSDVILLQRPAVGVDEVHIIDGYSYGLGAPGTMLCMTRAQEQLS